MKGGRLSRNLFLFLFLTIGIIHKTGVVSSIGNLHPPPRKWLDRLFIIPNAMIKCSLSLSPKKKKEKKNPSLPMMTSSYWKELPCLNIRRGKIKVNFHPQPPQLDCFIYSVVVSLSGSRPSGDDDARVVVVAFFPAVALFFSTFSMKASPAL